MKKALVIFTLLLILVSVIGVNALVTKRISWGLDRITGNAVGPGPITIQPINASAPCPTKLKFTNGEGLNFDFDINVLADRVNIATPAGANKLHFYESNSRENKTIGLNEYFVLTEKSARVPFTHILQYTGHTPSSRTLSFNDMGRGARQAVYDSASNSAILVIAGIAYRIYADPLTGRIAVDQNADSSFDGSQAMIVDSNARAFPQENFVNHPKCGFVATCVDSDNGKNYPVFGNISGTFGGNNLTWNDYCANSTTLYEMYCENASIPSFNIHDCPYGCMNGVCVEQEVPATCPTSISFTNNEGIYYTMNITVLPARIAVKDAQGEHQLHFYESTASTQANVNPGDYFVLSDMSNTPFTHILVFKGVICLGSTGSSPAVCSLQFTDLATGTREIVLGSDNTGSLVVAGITHNIVAPANSYGRIIIDQNGDGAINGGQAMIYDKTTGKSYSQEYFVDSPLCRIASSCTDSDNGKNYSVFGNISGTFGGNNLTWNDYCANFTTLYEMYCENASIPSFNIHDCPYGCMNGVCVEAAAIKCNDSDNSPDYFNNPPASEITFENNPDLFAKGVGTGKYGNGAPVIYGIEPNPATAMPATDPFSTFNDYCQDTHKIIEAYCTSDGNLSSIAMDCPNGCRDGACLPRHIQPNCFDSDNSPNYGLTGLPQTHIDQKKNSDLYVRGYAIVSAHMPQSAPQIKGEDPNKCSIRFLGSQSDYAIFYDCCTDTTTLQESFCGGNHELLSVPINCAYSCKQGMCDPGPATFVCSDSDSDTVNSPNLKEKGVIKFPGGEYTDSCVNSISPKTPCGPGITCNSVSEVDCDPNSASGVSERVLPCQYGCSMGACLPPPQTPTIINCADVVYVAQGNTQQPTKASRIQYCLSNGLPWAGVILQAETYNWYGNCRANSAEGFIWDTLPNAQFNLNTCQLTTQTAAAAQPSAAQTTTTTTTAPAPSPAQVREMIGCAFYGSKSLNKCYSTKGDSCSGRGRCFVRVRGPSGEKIIWRSTCSGNVVTTTDGVNEWVQFACGNETTVPPLTSQDNMTIQNFPV